MTCPVRLKEKKCFPKKVMIEVFILNDFLD